MKACHHCGVVPELEGTFCAQCGARQVGGAAPRGVSAPADAPVDSQATATLLARANLLRLRGRWPEAADLCAEALRLDPQSGAAPSLLGDVHADQGNLADALHWYSLAVERNPGSQADQSRRARIQELLEARQRRAEWTAAIQGDASALGARIRVRESLQRVVAVAGAAVCSVLLVTAILFSASARVPVSSPPETPVVAPPPRPTPPGQTDREARDLAEMTHSGQADNREHGMVASLQIMARSSTAQLSVIPPEGTLSLAPLSLRRETIMRDCYWMAFSLRSHDHALREIQVRALGETRSLDSPRATRVSLFEGTLRPDNLFIDPNLHAPTAAELYDSFRDPWWNESLRG